MTSCFVKGFSGQLLELEEEVERIENFSREYGYKVWSSPARLFQGVMYKKNERLFILAISEYILGRIYLQLVEGDKPASLSMMAKNIGFLLKNVPSAAKKAEKHFNQAIEITEEIGAKNYSALAYLDLGLLHRAKKRTDQAKECISMAIELFEQCEAEGYLQQAKEALASLA